MDIEAQNGEEKEEFNLMNEIRKFTSDYADQIN